MPSYAAKKLIREFDRVRWLAIVVSAAYICGMLMSPQLWFDVGRSFPRAPILSSFTFSEEFVLSIALVVTLVLSAFKMQRYLAAGIVLTIVLVFLDQARLQPWVYQYAIMLSLFAFVNPNNQKTVIVANQFVIAMLYFWSGLQKFSWTFINEVVPTLIEPFGARVSPEYLKTMALTIAIYETLIGIGLLIRKTRRIAVVMACVMHAVILVTFVLSRRNAVIWPWNVGMMFITIVIFFRNDENPFHYLLRRWRDSSASDYLPKAAMFVCGLLPALSFVGAWDLNLSAALYTGRTPVAVMRISESMRNRLPATARNVIFTTARGELMLPFYECSLADLNVPPYPEVRVYRQIARQLCALDADQQTNALIVRSLPALRDGSYHVTLTTCAELLSHEHQFDY